MAWINMDDELKKEVENAIEGAGESSDQKPSEEVPSGDVKPASESKETEKAEEPKANEQEPVKEVSKSDEQIKNLNKALQEERERAKELRAKLEELEQPLTKLKDVFWPPKTEQKPSENEEQKFLTHDQLEEFLEKKENERKEEIERQKRAEQLEKEINTLESEWNWKDGKPKYDDSEVIQWQRDNNKLYLSPSEAFFAMKKEELLDYEVKQRLSSKPEVREVNEQSAISPESKEEKVWEDEIKNAVLEAIEAEMTQNNN